MSAPNLLQSVKSASISEGGEFGFIQLELESADDTIVEFAFGADIEALSALVAALAQVVMAQRVALKDGPTPPTTLGIKSVGVTPGKRADGTDAIALNLELMSGEELVFGMERSLADRLHEGLMLALPKN